MKFGQLTGYNLRNIFVEKNKKWTGTIFPPSFSA